MLGIALDSRLLISRTLFKHEVDLRLITNVKYSIDKTPLIWMYSDLVHAKGYLKDHSDGAH